MADFAPPSGPPPPQVPQGWKAIWNEQYQEWFYVNLSTKQSQWEKPTTPANGPFESQPGGLPGYDHTSSKPTGPEKLGSNNPYAQHQPDLSEDERLARQLQAEEDARAHGRPSSRGAANDFYAQGPSQYQAGPAGGMPGYGAPPPPPQSGYDQPLPPREDKKKGLLGKLMGKASSSGSHGHYPPQQGYGAYQQPHHGGYGYPPQGYGYGHGAHGAKPPKKHGMGAGGAAALGVGGGLLGGAALAGAMDGGDDGGYGGDDGGGDFGGGDGGDGGGDFGGGDFGGGD